MGLFDRFKSSTAEKRKTNPAAKWADRVERRVQNYDRQEAIDALAAMGTPEAAEVLLKRFTFHIDPSITDQEEKESAFRGVLRAGAQAIEPIRAFVGKAESLAWPMKLLKELVGEDQYVEELLRWLSAWDTEYSKFVDPKVQLLAELEQHRHPRIATEVERFLDDVNEPARFHAASTLLAQDDAAVVPALANLLISEESVRVRGRVAEGLAAHGWVIAPPEREVIRKALPAGYALDGVGHVVKS